MKPLDSLRAIAVLMVITWHWVPQQSINKFPNGPACIVIFLVLSGFSLHVFCWKKEIKRKVQEAVKEHFLGIFTSVGRSAIF